MSSKPESRAVRPMMKTKAFCLLVLIFFWQGAGLAQTVVVTDQAGRTIKVDQPVNRVVTTFIPATLFALCSDLGGALVGASNKDDTASVYEALVDQENPPALVGNRTAGISIETVFSLKPDLVILYGQKDGVRLADRFTSMGIPALVIMPESMPLMMAALDMIGTAAGKRAHTDKVVNAMKEVKALIQGRLAKEAAAATAQPKVYYAGSSLLSTVSGNMLQNQMIGLAGGANVSEETKGFFVAISREQLLSWNPEVIIASDRLNSEGGRMLASPELASIAAVKTRRIFRVPGETYWDFPSPLAMAGVLWMAGKIHPGLFPDPMIQEEITAFYDTLFGEGFSARHPKVLGRTTRHGG